MKPFQQFTLSIKCARCGARDGHWCREQGRAVLPHPERRRAAVAASCGILRPNKQPSKQVAPTVRKEAS